jgi:Fe2+ transport system protein B
MTQQGKWWLLVPAFLGLLLLARFIPSIAWLSRISFAFLLGISSGVAIPRQISSFILKQVEGTLKPLVTAGDGGGAWMTWAGLNALLVLIGVVSVLFYFFFSLEHTGTVRRVARVGIYFLMVSFGAAFGYTVMARMSLLIGRFDELMLYASASYGYATPVLLVAMIAGLLWWEQGQARKT